MHEITEIVAACSDPPGSCLVDAEPLTPGSKQSLIDALADRKFHVVVIDGSSVTDKPKLFSALDAGFLFPWYFGRNWDAVDECLRDLSCLRANGFCCILASARVLRNSDQNLYDHLLDSFRFAFEDRWTQEDIPFKLVLG